MNVLKPMNNRITSIIILTYNKLEYTKMCIESIRVFTEIGKCEVIVVDNNSTDGTIEWLNDQSDLKVIYNKENKGFPAGCNQGIRIANGDNILLLNNDVIVTNRWLENLDKALWSDEKIGAVGAVTNSCSYYQTISAEYKSMEEMFEFAENNNKSNKNLWEDRTKLIGFCMLIKKSVIDKVGLLDERYTPGNFEDDDLSFRILKEGYRLILCKDVFIHHFGSVSFGEKIDKVLKENLKKFEEKWKFNPEYSNGIRFDLISKIKEESTKRFNVLEVGCGTGATLLEIRNRYRNSNIYGIEINIDAANIASCICNTISTDIENADLPYNEEYFDYIILGDVLEHLNNPWKVLNYLKKYLKNNGHIIASIPNIIHISVMRNLANGNFSYEDKGILDKTHIRFFTLAEIHKLFNDNNYNICDINSICIPITNEDEEFINIMCKLYGEELRNQYKSYQYIIKASKGIDYNRYAESDMIQLKYRLMRIDNELDVINSINYIFNLYHIYGEEIVSDIEYLLGISIINKENVLNRIGVEAFNSKLYEFSILILMLALKINKNDVNTIYNLTYLLTKVGEYETAFNILSSSSDLVKKDVGIDNIMKEIKEYIYG